MMRVSACLLGFLSVSLLSVGSPLAHSPRYAYEGMFVGSMICESGELGVLFHIEETGTLTLLEFNADREPCRSGAGRCNDARDLQYRGTRKVKGTLDVFPTAANPNVPENRFNIIGTGARYETPESAAKAMLDPNEVHTSLELRAKATQKLFQNGPTELGFRIVFNNPLASPPYDKMFTRIDSQQCHNLRLSRVKE